MSAAKDPLAGLNVAAVPFVSVGTLAELDAVALLRLGVSDPNGFWDGEQANELRARVEARHDSHEPLYWGLASLTLNFALELAHRAGVSPDRFLDEVAATVIRARRTEAGE